MSATVVDVSYGRVTITVGRA